MNTVILESAEDAPPRFWLAMPTRCRSKQALAQRRLQLRHMASCTVAFHGPLPVTLAGSPPLTAAAFA